MFPSSGERWKVPTKLGPLEIASLHKWTTVVNQLKLYKLLITVVSTVDKKTISNKNCGYIQRSKKKARNLIMWAQSFTIKLKPPPKPEETAKHGPM
jgi:hypothetical protein